MKTAVIVLAILAAGLTAGAVAALGPGLMQQWRMGSDVQEAMRQDPHYAQCVDKLNSGDAKLEAVYEQYGWNGALLFCMMDMAEDAAANKDD